MSLSKVSVILSCDLSISWWNTVGYLGKTPTCGKFIASLKFHTDCTFFSAGDCIWIQTRGTDMAKVMVSHSN
jgi:hypothetical protein